MFRDWSDAVRRNHALEHATVAVLLSRHGPTRLAGRAMADGFVIVGNVGPDELMISAREALCRLQVGEANLAVSPLCGTNVAVGAFLSALGVTAVLATGRLRSRLPNAFLAGMVGALAGQPIGRLAQKHVTTLVDHEGVELVGAHTISGRLHKVQTVQTRSTGSG